MTTKNKRELKHGRSAQTVKGKSYSDAELDNLYRVRKHANTAPPLLKQGMFTQLSSAFTKPKPW